MKADVSKSFEQFSNLTQNLMSAVASFNEIVSARVDQFLKLNNAVINENLERNMQYLRSLSEVKRPEDAVSQQMAYLNDNAKYAMDTAKKYFSLAMETNAEMNSAFQQNMQKAGDKTAAAAKKAA